MSASHASTEDLLALLDRDRAALLAQIARVPAARQTQRREPDRWSAAEIVEHLARIDLNIAKLLALRTAEATLATPEQLSTAQFTPHRVRQVRSRTAKVVAPERIRPTGTLDIDTALAQLASARETLKAACRAVPAALLDGAIHPHPIIGTLTLRGWVEFAAHHDARHAEQVGELADGWSAED
jgi:hypothetical protein